MVEVKRAGMNLRDRQILQATNYGAYSGIRWALLTNLLVWKLYRISLEDRVECHLVFNIDFSSGRLRDEQAYRMTLLSHYGLSRKNLLERIWVKTSALSAESIMAALQNEEVIGRLRKVLIKETGACLDNNEVRAALERHLQLG